jgi:hypothetical protein
MSIQETGPLIGMLPNVIKPILGPLITFKGRMDCRCCIEFLEPIVKERLTELIPPVTNYGLISQLMCVPSHLWLRLLADDIFRTIYYSGS